MFQQRVVYQRIATRNQDYEMPRRKIKEHFKKQVEGAEWIEEQESGTKSARKEYQRLREMIYKGLVHKIYLYAWDRIARRISEMFSSIQG